ncbi:MAG: 2-C-methyl-D-erythritol 4-phosphate cytidylyltransferase [Lachnospiraceae bacterium]|nr:2-C-methyl-D-erythritol 4-phosphate cytidylyltransferase [Lachnospiraceae bacterium]
MERRSLSVILLAGGSGTRFGCGQNKVFLLLEGQPVLQHSLRVFLEHPAVDEVILVYRSGDEAEIRAVLSASPSDKPVRIITGGDTRQGSVRRGLALVRGERVMIHDGARPRISRSDIDALLAVMPAVPGAALAVPSPDTVKITDDAGLVLQTTDRAHTWLIQTPQCFETQTLRCLHERFRDRRDMTDDCMLLEAAGLPVRLVRGREENRKLTRPYDLALLSSRLPG